MIVVFKTYNVKEKKIPTMKSETIEKFLAPIWNRIRCEGHGKGIATVDAQFDKETIAKRF